MNTLELKGSMIEMIAKIKGLEVLQRLYHIMETAIETEQDVVELSAEQEMQLDNDLAASESEENLVSHEEAKRVMTSYKLQQAATPTRKNISLEQLKKEQNYQPITYEKWKVKADKIEWEESLEELLEAVK